MEKIVLKEQKRAFGSVDYLFQFKNNKFNVCFLTNNNKEIGNSLTIENGSILLVNRNFELTGDYKGYYPCVSITKAGMEFGYLPSLKLKTSRRYSALISDYLVSVYNDDIKANLERNAIKYYKNNKLIKEFKEMMNVQIIEPLHALNDINYIYTGIKPLRIRGNYFYEILKTEKGFSYMSVVNSNLRDTNDALINISYGNGNDSVLISLGNKTIKVRYLLYTIEIKDNISVYNDHIIYKVEHEGGNNFSALFKSDTSSVQMFNGKATIVKGKSYKNALSIDSFEDSIDFKPSINLKDLTALNFNDDILNKNPEDELNKLIGLENVKKQIYRFKKSCIKALNNDTLFNLHMMFLGNPGTGKTTVARLIADIFYKNGILPTNNYVEGSRDTLVGMYVGETEEKTNAIFQQALGGVLFIDEAYSLHVPNNPSDFGNVAMAELIKLMEDYRGKICVIFAGYTKEMHDLLKMNVGLKSRIQYEIIFDDYSKNELEDILDFNLNNKQYKIDEDGKKLLIDAIDDKRNYPNYGNAREIRTALEQILLFQAERTFDNVSDRLINKDDVIKYIEQNNLVKKEMPKLYKMIDYSLLKKYSTINLDFNNDYSKIIESCILIESNDSKLNSSTGFIISPDGYAVTCAHSITNIKRLYARRRVSDRLGNIVNTYHTCEVCKIDTITDLAIIKLENKNNSKFPYLPLDFENEIKPILTPVIIFSYPLGIEVFDNLSVFKGYISSYQYLLNHDVYNYDLISLPGSSGSCVLDLNTMKVIGVVNACCGEKNNSITIGSRVKDIIKLIKEGN